MAKKRKAKARRPAGVKGRKAPREVKVSHSDLVDEFLLSYEHGMANNAPRNRSELSELRALLGREVRAKPLSSAEVQELESVYSGTSRLGWETSIPKVSPESFEVGPGLSVPATVNNMPIPENVMREHPELRGLRFLQVGNKLVFVDDSHVIREVAVVSGAKAKPKRKPAKHHK